MDIAANIEKIRSGIEEACSRVGRDPGEVHLVAVSKTKPAELIDAAAAAGQDLFGESYVQEFLAKYDEVGAAVKWHFIGHLQSNKAKYLVDKVSMIHSVDRLSLARELDRQWGRRDSTLEVLLQVNLGDEQSKSGTTARDALELARRLADFPNLRLKGLMTLPPFFDDPEEVRPYFRQLHELAHQIERLALPGVEMRELSMGMSHDYQVAVEEGATLVRVGSSIFGARDYS